jgi:superfamily I DNA/RNA helicase
VELSTVHRAKGLEADRVFILAPEKLPLVWAGQQAWETEQEQNLRYVALTRARRELYFVTEAPVKTTAPAAEKELALT